MLCVPVTILRAFVRFLSRILTSSYRCSFMIPILRGVNWSLEVRNLPETGTRTQISEALGLVLTFPPVGVRSWASCFLSLPQFPPSPTIKWSTQPASWITENTWGVARGSVRYILFAVATISWEFCDLDLSSASWKVILIFVSLHDLCTWFQKAS